MSNGLTAQQAFQVAKEREDILNQRISEAQTARASITNQNDRIKNIRLVEVLAVQRNQARVERQRLAIIAKGGSQESAAQFAATQQAGLRAGIGQEQAAKRGVTPINVANLQSQLQRGQISQEQFDRQSGLASRQQAVFQAGRPSPFRAQREQAFARSRAVQQLGQPSREIAFRQQQGITQTLVTARPEPFIGLSPALAGRVAAEGGVEVITQVPLRQVGDVFRPVAAPVARIPRLQVGRAEVSQPVFVGGLGKQVIGVREFGGQIRPVALIESEAERRIRFLSEVSKEDKEFISKIKFTAQIPQFIGKPLRSAILFEETKIVPFAERFFEVSPKQVEAERKKLRERLERGEIGGKEFKFLSVAQESFFKLAKFESRPITNILPFVIGGAAFGTAETLLAKGVTKVPKLFEAVTSPLGQTVVKTGRRALIAGVLTLEGIRVARDPSEIGKVAIEIPSFLVGSRLASSVAESAIVRESFFGSPTRRIQEVAGIKRISPESFEEAIRTSVTPVSPEVRKLGVVELQKELREASDLVQAIRGKFKPEVKRLTPEFLLQSEFLRGKGLTKPKAERLVRVLETTPAFLKGSITSPLQLEGVRPFKDIDIAIAERSIPLFERRVLKATGIPARNIFDIKTFEEGRITATAQIEPLRLARTRRGGVQITGAVEQPSRKIEGALRFALGEAGGETRAKDIPDVFQLRRKIEEARRPKIFEFERLPEGQRVKIVEPRLVGEKVGKPVRVTPSVEDRLRRIDKSVLAGVSRKPSLPSVVSLKPSRPSQLPSSVPSLPSSLPSKIPSVSPPSIVPSRPPPSPPSRPSTQLPPSISSLPSVSSISSSFRSSFFGFERPPTPTVIPPLVGFGEFGRPSPQARQRLKPRVAPSLFGIVRGLRTKKLPERVTGFEIRPVPESLLKGRPIGLSAVLSVGNNKVFKGKRKAFSLV